MRQALITTLTETRSLYDAAHDPKRLWIIAGAAHVDLQRFARVEYEHTVLDFLAEHLPATGNPL